MPHQEAVTIRAWIRPDAIDALRATLATINADVESNALVPFGSLPEVHFGRFVILDDAPVNGRIVPASLVYASNVDAPSSAHLDALTAFGIGLDEVWQHCDGYPAPEARTTATRLEYLNERMIPTAAFYVNTLGRSVKQAREEAALRDALQVALDRKPGLHSADDVMAAVREYCRNDPSLCDALTPAEGLSAEWRTNEVATIVQAALGAIVLAPFAIVIGIPWLLYLHRLEIQDASEPPLRLGEYRRGKLAIAEDHVVQNQFSAVGSVKLHWLRRLTLKVLLAAADFATRHHFNKGDLGTVPLLGLNGVDTIHFAQWIVLDDGYRVLFLSNYDGSLTSYMDDFINKVAWGLNLVFSNGVGYPRTDWLVKGGARNSQAFKNYLRRHQVANSVWYKASPGLTAMDLARHGRIREGLERSSMSDREIEDWLRLL
jgi:hypothetical protein